MKTISKRHLSIDTQQTLSLPSGSQVLYVGTQDNAPCLWATVDTEQQAIALPILCFCTGDEIDPILQLMYLGSTSVDGLELHHYLNQTVYLQPDAK